MGWLRNVIFGDPTCTRCARVRYACICGIDTAAMQKRAVVQRLPAPRKPRRRR